MIQSMYGKYFLVCDICGYEGPSFESFDDAVEAKEENDWKVDKYEDEWLNLCPACVI